MVCSLECSTPASMSRLLLTRPSFTHSISSLDALVDITPPAGDKAAGEGYDQPPELFNETGVPIEPFNLNREREEGTFDAGGSYIAHNLPQVEDAWLAGIDGKLRGVAARQKGRDNKTIFRLSQGCDTCMSLLLRNLLKLAHTCHVAA